MPDDDFIPYSPQPQGSQQDFIPYNPAPSPKRNFDANFNTTLSPNEEQSFKTWKSKFAPQDSGQDYDLRGAFKAGITPAANGHWPDTYKKPNHPTFSNESQYAQYGNPGMWNGDQFIPAPQKKLAPVVNAQGKSTYMPSEAAGPTPGASPFNRTRDMLQQNIAKSAQEQNIAVMPTGATKFGQPRTKQYPIQQKIEDIVALMREWDSR